MSKALALFSGFGLIEKSLLAAVCVGLCCGLLGSFVVVRRVALVGDALSHAVLPGVVVGFALSEERNIWLVFACALAVGLLGVLMVRAVVNTTRLKSDAALGIVLASFFGVGIFMNSLVQKAGVKSFLYGELSTISDADLLMMGVASVVVVVVVMLLLRPFRVLSFDEGYATGLGYPVALLNGIFFGLLGFTVVVTMQAVGVILVSAMLITPAATAYLLSERLEKMMWLAVSIGVVTAITGFLISLKVDLLTGPLIAMVGAVIFAAVYFFAPRHGVVARWLRFNRRRHRVQRENSLKAIYKCIEKKGGKDHTLSLKRWARSSKGTVKDMVREGNALVRAGEATWMEGKKRILLTASGWQRAVEVVRNHRLWELYLTNEANYAADHVHDDAEKIEHILGARTVRQLERELNFPEKDPHGSQIPKAEEMVELAGELKLGKKTERTGY